MDGAPDQLLLHVVVIMTVNVSNSGDFLPGIPDVFDIAYRDMPDTAISLRSRLDRDRAERYAGCGG